MALSTRKKNMIIADWKTGKFKSYYSIAKHHKINEKTAKKILDKIQHENSDVVEVCVVAESAKKSVKNPIELKAVENAVQERLKIHEVSNKLLEKIEKHIEGNTKLEKINVGDGVQNFEEVGLGSSDYKNLADAIDKVSVTTGVNPRFAQSQVNIQNNVQNNLEHTGIEIKFSED